MCSKFAHGQQWQSWVWVKLAELTTTPTTESVRGASLTLKVERILLPGKTKKAKELAFSHWIHSYEFVRQNYPLRKQSAEPRKTGIGKFWCLEKREDVLILEVVMNSSTLDCVSSTQAKRKGDLQSSTWNTEYNPITPSRPWWLPSQGAQGHVRGKHPQKSIGLPGCHPVC